MYATSDKRSSWAVARLGVMPAREAFSAYGSAFCGKMGFVFEMNILKQLDDLPEAEQRMPVLFIGHGNPMNGIEVNQYTSGWKQAIEGVPKPKVVVVVSAHWETIGTKVTANRKPNVIYDFGGFPPALYEAKYEAFGDPAFAREISDRVCRYPIEADLSWGLDHGSWTILRHLLPAADVPVLQISLDRSLSPAQHYELAGELDFLRDRGGLIIGSGNMVHNLRELSFGHDGGFDWARSANNTFKDLILSGVHEKLIGYHNLGEEVELSVPTAEHFLPLLYVLGLKTAEDAVEIFNDSVVLGSISMTSVRIG